MSVQSSSLRFSRRWSSVRSAILSTCWYELTRGLGIYIVVFGTCLYVLTVKKYAFTGGVRRHANVYLVVAGIVLFLLALAVTGLLPIACRRLLMHAFIVLGGDHGHRLAYACCLWVGVGSSFPPYALLFGRFKCYEHRTLHHTDGDCRYHICRHHLSHPVLHIFTYSIDLSSLGDLGT